MPKVVVLGGNGQVGGAAARALVAGGWDVVTTGRAEERFPADLREDVGSVVFASSKAVYVDDRGRHSNSDEPPDFGGPVTEEQPTLPPTEDVPYDSREGYGANHPTAAVNLAALVAFCAGRPAARVLNSADPDAPDGLGVARALAAHLGHAWDEVLLDDAAPEGLGDHPWNTLPPFLLDTSAAGRLGFEPVGTYTETVGAAVDWLVARHDAGRPVPEEESLAPYFDYHREDAWVAAAPA